MNELGDRKHVGRPASPAISELVCECVRFFLFCKKEEGERPWLPPLLWQLSARSPLSHILLCSGRGDTQMRARSRAPAHIRCMSFFGWRVRTHTHTHGRWSDGRLRQLRAPAGVTEVLCQVIASTLPPPTPPAVRLQSASVTHCSL